MAAVVVVPRTPVEDTPRTGDEVANCRWDEMLVVVSLGIGKAGRDDQGRGNLADEAPASEHERPEAEDELEQDSEGVKEQDEPARLDRQQGEDLQGVVEVSETLTLAPCHWSPHVPYLRITFAQAVTGAPHLSV